MHFYTAARNRIELDHLDSRIALEGGLPFVAVPEAEAAAPMVSNAARAHFGMAPRRGAVRSAAPVTKAPPPAVFRERATGLLRVVYREMVIRFKSKVTARQRRQILAKHGLKERSRNSFIRRQWVLYAESRPDGPRLLEIVNEIAEMDEVVFATPNFVSEYRRNVPEIPVEQWHLKNTAAAPGQVEGEDVNAESAWSHTLGNSSIVVAVLDDGVDIDHPNLSSNILRNPNPNDPRDTVGRDFFVPDDDPGTFDPRPKIFRFPFDRLAGNDIHGTPCAGVIAAPGLDGGALGIAPECKILAIKIFHADQFAPDARVADAIRYAALHADILSCSWSGGRSPDIDLAIDDAVTSLGRNGKGSAIFCAAGNDFANRVSFPASHPNTIAVGATTDTARRADYSNQGPTLTIAAPSSGGIEGIYTTDVSLPNRGFNLGSEAAGGADGLHTDSFGGTSSATPLAAGIGALILSQDPSLEPEALRERLKATAEKIGSGYDENGHSLDFGFGRVDAAAALS
ncbi:MAG: S8 family serine peptidase [bacterium]|nr:S8 family serine peptidase [bacterium]